MPEVLNQDVVDELLALSEDGDPELLVDLIQMFLADGPAKVAAIRSGIGEQDWDGVERAAHSLKGSAGNLGASRVLADCENLQLACRQNRVAEIGSYADSLAGNFAEATSALQALLRRYS